MKTIIAGSRDVTPEEFSHGLEQLPKKVIESITEVVSGLARGPDSYGKSWAESLGLPVTGFKPDWDSLGKKAGIMRNIDMGDYSDQALVFWDGKSKGSNHMISYMRKKNKPVYVINTMEF